MPPAVAAAAVTAAATIGSGALQSRSANKATKATQRATSEALAFEAEREAYNRAQRERANEDYRRQYEAWQNQRLGLLRRYGINVPAGGTQGTRASLSALSRRPMSMSGSQRTLGSLSGWR